MTGPLRPVGPVQPRGPQRRTGDRRRGEERREGEAPPVRALVPADEPPVPAPEPPAAAPSPAQPSAFTAQMIGQAGVRKGLKGGPPVLDAARGAYLETEYSGPRDRRPRPGKAGRTDI